ncbi:hypothetical protein IKG02_00425 [Candidatus Saccharibacteria bacterium]|nr:hypothetical protein [Candidatus Saccharibacteria bacterium]
MPKSSKSSKKSKTPSSKASKPTRTSNYKSACNCPSYLCLSIFLGLLLVLSLLFNICLSKDRKTYEEQKRLIAFEPLASSYIYNLYENDPSKVATATGVGITEDDDLYIDFYVTEYDNHVPLSTKKARLHFQCDDHSGKVFGTDSPDGCAFAYWYDEPKALPEEYQEKSRAFYEKAEEYTSRVNSAETEEEKQAIREEMGAWYEGQRPFLEEMNNYFSSL